MMRLGKLCGAHTVEYVNLDEGEEYLLTTGIIAESNVRQFSLIILSTEVDGGFLHDVSELVEVSLGTKTVTKEF